MSDNKIEVLIVDDNTENLKVLSNLLLEENYKVRVAKNGVQALATIKESAPHLALLDVQMPEMDGFELCERIKKDSSIPQFPIIFISALGDSFNKNKGFEVGAVDFINKPFDADEVKARVKVNTQVLEYMDKIRVLEAVIAEKDEEIENLRSKLK